jgi:hypothetical protein
MVLKFFHGQRHEPLLLVFSRTTPAEPKPCRRLYPSFPIRVSFAYLVNHSFMMDMAARCTAARQLFSVSDYKARQRQGALLEL